MVALRLRCGYVAVRVNRFLTLFSSLVAKFINVVHTLEPGETELLGVSPGSKLCAVFLNIAHYLKTVRCGCGAFAFIFSIYLKPVIYLYLLAAVRMKSLLQCCEIALRCVQTTK